MRLRFLLAASCFLLSLSSWANPRIRQPLIARTDPAAKDHLAAVLSLQTAAIVTYHAVSEATRVDKGVSEENRSKLAVLVISDWSLGCWENAPVNVVEFFYHGSQVLAIGLQHPSGDVTWTHAVGRGPLGPCFLKDLTGQGADYFIFTDHLGTPFAWFNPDNGETTYTPFNPWGELLAISPSRVPPYENGNVANNGFDLPTFEVFEVTPLGLAGHIYDERTGLVYMHHRYLHPRLGHFLTPDFRAPNIYDPSTFTEPYAYAAGNPIMFWDPDGLAVADYYLKSGYIGTDPQGIRVYAETIWLLHCPVTFLYDEQGDLYQPHPFWKTYSGKEVIEGFANTFTDPNFYYFAAESVHSMVGAGVKGILTMPETPADQMLTAVLFFMPTLGGTKAGMRLMKELPKTRTVLPKSGALITLDEMVRPHRAQAAEIMARSKQKWGFPDKWAAMAPSTNLVSPAVPAVNNAVVRALDAPFGLRNAAIEVHNLAGKTQRSITHSTVAIARVKLPNGTSNFFASGSGGYLGPRQRALLEKYGVPAENIFSGVKYIRGYSRLENHAERVIARNLPAGSIVEDWGISWAGKQKPIPCPSCKPELDEIGGLIQIGE